MRALQDIIEVRQKQFEMAETRFQAGRVNKAGVGVAECLLLEAKIRLAVEESDQNEAITSADRVQRIRQKCLDALLQQPQDRVISDELHQAQVDEAEARLKLEELKYRFAVLRDGPR